MKKLDLLFAVLKVPLDYLALITASSAAYFLRVSPYVVSRRPVIFDLTFGQYLPATALIAVGWIVVYALLGLYAVGGIRKKLEEIKRIIIASTAALGGVLAMVVFSRELFESRFILLASWGLAIVFVWFARLILRAIKNGLYRSGVGLKCVAVVGKGGAAQAIVDFIKHNPKFGLKIVGVVELWNKQTEQTLHTVHTQGQLDQIMVVGVNGAAGDLHSVLDFADEHHLPFRYSADLIASHGAGLEYDTLAGVPLIEIKRTRLEGWGRVYKRIFDIVGSVILIMLTSPLMLLTALAIKLDSRGPVFFKYPRVGEAGKPFHYLKFRSMKPGTHEMRYKELKHLDIRRGPLTKFRDQDDPRVTSVGRFIRKWSLDELPELFLVLAGKMSLVGPRPHLPEEVARYEKHHKKVLTIKPGITGLAQISGRADLSFDEEVRLDTYYMEHWSLKLDLIILIKTPFAVLVQKGTY